MAMKPVKVSQLNGYIKRILQTDPLLGHVSVKGEISNLKFHGSGHVYFTLKDESSKLNCFLPAGNLQNIRYELSEGMEINAVGYIYLYERGGSYSLNVKDIQVEGLGDLAVAFEKLKTKLSAEGLFDESCKKEIPFFPEKIAVITSETGAAIRDILKIIKNKNQYVDILIYPVLVQGPHAAGEIAAALDHINREFPEIDTIIVGRGGGSMEELWAFNEEIVARSIFASKIPVISAVGHEIDFTIADFAADKRAETPTAAADMAVPDIEELKQYIGNVREKLQEALEHFIHVRELKLQQLNLDVFRRDLESRIAMEQMRIENIIAENRANAAKLIERSEQKIEMHRLSLESLSPRNIMKRGYAAVLTENREMIGSGKNIAENDRLTVVFSDAEADCRIEEIRRGQ